MRWSKLWAVFPALCLTLVLLKVFLPPSRIATTFPSGTASLVAPEKPLPPAAPIENVNPAEPPSDPPLAAPTSAHPIESLVEAAQQQFQALKAKQSKTLAEAVSEYRRRYGISPPPLFDKWYGFATKRGVELIDEFDTIMDNLLPFWALQPGTIRARVREALGYNGNGLIALLIRNGKVAKIEGGPSWQLNVMKDMMKEFATLLPDMDLAFNLHDEPRIVVPHDELSRMVAIAQEEALPAANAVKSPTNGFSSPPGDLDDATRRIKEIKTSRFNEYPHQSTWIPSRLSCSPDSPARSFQEAAEDETSVYAYDDAFGFISNHTAFSDICNSPSLRTSFGFFDRPNAFKIAHELIPIFSQSKISSYQDILYPSPWYYYGKTVTDQPAETHQLQYIEEKDMAWEAKNTSFWWRGSTTGGFSRDGGWRRQHRQQFVQRISGLSDAKVLVRNGDETAPQWDLRTAPRADYKDLIDIHFSGVGQCDPGDCDAQREYFDMAMPVDPQKAWAFKYLLDIDGNAFSGRFYSFLRSNSLTLKLSIFREWHEEWLLPWVHYLPLSMRGEEHLEVVRYLSREEQGKMLGPKMAKESQEWAGKVLRNSDMEVWFFRLLLEYARVIDDNRASIGFGG